MIDYRVWNICLCLFFLSGTSPCVFFVFYASCDPVVNYKSFNALLTIDLLRPKCVSYYGLLTGQQVYSQSTEMC